MNQRIHVWMAIRAVALFDDEENRVAVLDKARTVDKVFGITFKNEIPGSVEQYLWLDTIYMCRDSFAVASIIGPPDHSTTQHFQRKEGVRSTC